MVNNFVFGSWWVALCAAALALLSWKEAGGEGIIFSLPVFVFGATLMVYNLNMLSGLKALRCSRTTSPRHLWCMNNERWMMAYLVAGAFLALPSIFMLRPSAWWLLAPTALVAMLYVLPMMGGIRLREVGIWKIFLIATVWAVVTVGLPISQLDVFPQWQETAWLLVERWLFIFAITVPFDVRDLAIDASKGVRTLPSVLGWQRALMLALIALMACAVLAWLRLGAEAFVGLVPAVVTAFLLIAYTHPERKEMYYSFWIEGTMFILALGGLLQLCAG